MGLFRLFRDALRADVRLNAHVNKLGAIQQAIAHRNHLRSAAAAQLEQAGRAGGAKGWFADDRRSAIAFEHGDKILCGRDGPTGGEKLHRALKQGFISGGAKGINVGFVIGACADFCVFLNAFLGHQAFGQIPFDRCFAHICGLAGDGCIRRYRARQCKPS